MIRTLWICLLTLFDLVFLVMAVVTGLRDLNVPCALFLAGILLISLLVELALRGPDLEIRRDRSEVRDGWRG